MEEHFKRFKFVSFLLGLVMGVFVQISTLGANYLAITTNIVTKSNDNTIILTMAFSVINAGAATLMLGLIRNMVSITYCHSDMEQSEDMVLNELLLQLEWRFFNGAVLGCSLAWITTDFLLGTTIGNGLMIYTPALIVIGIWSIKRLRNYK